MAEVTIKKAEKSELRQILELQYLAYKSEAKLHDDFSIPPLKQTLEEVEQEFAKCVFLKAIDENGVIVGSVRAYDDDSTAYIGKLIVRPEMQSQGIGTKLVAAIEHEYLNMRYELFTGYKSVKNIRLYEYLGYVKFKEQKVSDKLTLMFFEKRSGV